MRMHVERKTIYKDKGRSYRLILGTTKFGVNFAYFNDSKVYNGISGIKVDDIGYACIDRVLYIPWAKFNTRGYTEYRKLSNKEYSSIIFAISQYMMGEIDAGPKNVFMYKDELESIEHKSASTTTVTTTESTTITTVENVSTTTVVEVEGTTSSDKKSDITPCIKSPTDLNHPTDTNKVDFHSVHCNDIDKFNNLGIQVENSDEKKSENVRYYDLLAVEPRVTYNNQSGKKNNESTKATRTKNNSIPKRIFSEDEALAISAMDTNSVSTKYNVSIGTARLMIRNAKRIFKFEVKNHDTRKNSYTDLFKIGYSAEEVAKMTNTELSKVEYHYKVYSCTGSCSQNAIDKWNSLIECRDYKSIISAVYDTSIVDFCVKEKCNTNVGTNIIYKLREFLNINPLFCVGFEKQALDADALKNAIDSIRNSKLVSNMSAVFVYDKTMELYDAYTTSYNDHAEILAGVKDIPDCVSDSNKDYFITLIYNRFNPNKLSSKKRILTKEQKDVIERGASAVEFAMAFMTSYNKAVAIKNSYRRRNKG